MKQSTVLVTSDGQRVLPADDEFFVALRDLAPGCEATGFAVRNLGFIKFQALDDGLTAIELHPPGIDRRAVLAAERRVAARATERFRIAYLDAGRPAEPALSAEAAIACLRELRAPPAAPVSDERFRVEPRDYARMLRDRDDPFGRLGQKWGAASGAFDETVVPGVLEQQPAAQLMIASVPRARGDPVIHSLNGAFAWLDAEYRAHAIGAKLETLPDREYGAWAAAFYKSVAQSGVPRFDRVTARVRFGDGLRLTYATRYERLLLPWRTAAGETFVSLMARKLDDGGDVHIACA